MAGQPKDGNSPSISGDNSFAFTGNPPFGTVDIIFTPDTGGSITLHPVPFNATLNVNAVFSSVEHPIAGSDCVTNPALVCASTSVAIEGTGVSSLPPSPIPGPIAGAGLPGLILASTASQLDRVFGSDRSTSRAELFQPAVTNA